MHDLHGLAVSVLVPTYRECANLPELMQRLRAVRERERLDLELLILDDRSRDGSREAVEAAALPWVRFHEREGRRGLSAAVVEGLALCDRNFVVVMDADLSHPPEALPELLAVLLDGAEFVFGSRYAEGGSTDADWGLLRWLNSRVAVLLARGLVDVADPMAGFFAFRRSLLARADRIDAIGYKIGLEILVRSGARRVAEVPIAFAERVHGESKLTLRVQLEYLKQLRRLYALRGGVVFQLLQFLSVGATGIFVNLAVLSAMLGAGAQARPAIAVGIAVSLVWNFLLNRSFTFHGASARCWRRQLVAYVLVCGLGATLNFQVASAILAVLPVGWPIHVAALCGIVSGTAVNFLGARNLVFRRVAQEG